MVMADSKIKIDFISTGTVRIRPSMRSQPFSTFTPWRLLTALRDTRWSESLPVGVFLIRHPEGLFLVDSGQSPCCHDPGYAPKLALFDDMLSNFDIKPEDDVVVQLSKLGVVPTDLKAVILTHLHGDHANGLESLLSRAPDLPVYVSRKHWDAFGRRPWSASLRGANPKHWPKPFNPRVFDFDGEPLRPWEKSYAVTADRRIILVDTSGHVPGHVGVAIFEDAEKSFLYFLPGDATYGLDILEKEEPDGINDDPVQHRETLRKIKQLARDHNVCVVPSHDINSAQILAERQIYKPAD